MIPCDICGKEGHAWFDCPKRSSKPSDWKPDRLMKPAKIDLRPGTVPEPVAFISATKGEAFVEVAKRGRGRPASIDDMKAYKAAKQREYRARIKAEKAGK
jgi:hypothetical protein